MRPLKFGVAVFMLLYLNAGMLAQNLSDAGRRMLVANASIEQLEDFLSQNMSGAKRRAFNAKLLELADNYEFYSTFGDEGSRAAFLNLCTDDSIPVVSDLPEHSFGRALTASEYAAALGSRENVSVTVKNLRRGDYTFSDGAWHCTLSFDKQLSYNDANGVLFSIDEYYGTDLHVEISCVYDNDADSFRIESISSSIDSAYPDLPESFDVLEKSCEADAKLKVAGRHLRFNSFDQAFVPKGAVNAWNDDIRLKRNYYARTEKYDYFSQSYHATHFRAKVHAGYAAGGSLKVSGETAFSKKKSIGWQAGAELGYTVPVGRVLTIGLFAGAGYSFSSLDLAVSDISYSYRMNGSCGSSYNRNYHISLAEDKLSFKDVYVPVYLNFDIRLMKGLLLGVDVGAKIYFSGITHAAPFHITGTVSGDAPSFTEADAVGDFDISGSSFLYPGSYSRDKIDYSLTAGLSLSYDLWSGLVWIYARCSFEMGLTDLHKSDGIAWFSEDTAYPVVYSPLGGGSNVVSRSFAGCVSYRRQAIWPELGMMFKF